ncbi:DUF5518 domain-containing protein [Haloplanus sp. C73]|uniref:DUF5518 domain-containing protein n=1 Tax=Haloplanus sp. C73 TaxID=3421641 RepID=UPI003EB97F60
MDSDLEGETLKNASIGVLVSSLLYFVPGINTIGPVFGGAVAGYLQQEGVTGGLKAGGAKGGLMIIPAIPISIIAGALLADVPVIGGLLAGSAIIVAIVIVGHSLLLGLGGGLIGGGLHSFFSGGDQSSSDSSGEIR